MPNKGPYESLTPEARESLAMQRLGAERQRAMNDATITVVDQDEQDDMLAATLLNQERDLYSHRVNLVRYEAMLANGATDAFRHHVNDLLLQTLDRLNDVTHIIEALGPQLPSAARLAAAIDRIKALEAAARPSTGP